MYTEGEVIKISFSADIKKQLCASVHECDECKRCETAGIIEFAGIMKDGVLRFSTENFDTAARIEYNMRKHCHATRTDRAFLFTIDNPDYIKQTTNNIFSDGDEMSSDFSECCMRAYVRGCFLGGGSINDPQKSYHLEFDTRNPAGIDHLKTALSILGYNTKITYRKGHYLVYVKESDTIADILGLMGAGKGAMELYTVQIEKDMRNSINRRINCETANMDKSFTASAKHIAAIKKIIDAGEMESLPDTLYEMARVRLEYPDKSLKELSDLMGIGKSGVNHRLKRLLEIAEEY